MESQNPHFFKGNKAYSPAQIQIYQLPHLSPLKPPKFSPDAFKPLNIDFSKLKQTFAISLPNKNLSQQQNSMIQFKKEVKPFLSVQVSALIKENETLKQQLEQMNKMYEEQKLKYNQLKNLYKEGEAMFEILEQKKISLQKENKELRIILQNLYKQLHKQNQHLETKKIPLRQNGQRKIQRVKIGNKQIPIIKVNVPPETFIKKQHSSSVFSLGCDQQTLEQNKNQIFALKQQNAILAESNNRLVKQLMEAKRQLTKSQIAAKNLWHQNKMNDQPQISEPVLIREQRAKRQLQDLQTQTGINNISNKSFQFFLSDSGKKSALNQNSNTYSSNYRQSENNISYYKSKYTILETELKKKDETIKNLYDQCYMLQAQINKLRSSPSKTFQFTHMTVKPNSHVEHQQKETEKEQAFYKNKINQLQGRINQLNQICIANINNSFKMNQLNETVSKLAKQNFILQQKLHSQESELQRLYKILQNKNTELSQIYTTLTQTKKHNLLDSKKKSMISMFESTPQKSQNQKETKRKVIFFQGQFSKDYSNQ